MRPIIRAAVGHAFGALAVTLCLPAVGHAAVADDLIACQEVIRTASIRLNARTQRHVGACVARGIACLVTGENGACCARAATRCRRDLRRLEGEERRFVRRLANLRCAEIPFERLQDGAGGVVPGLGFASTLDACSRLEPPVAVVDLPSLVECLRRLAREDVVHLVATVEMPLACDALACMELTSEFSTACDGDPATCEPGAAPSASPTATVTPVLTATPTETGTPMETVTPTSVVPTATVTAVPTTTATPTATSVPPTSTPVPTPTAVATIAPTETPTVTPTSIPTSTATATATPTVEPSPGGPLCGNGVMEDGEDCDDGNTVGCDDCPSDCSLAVNPCETDTVRHEQQITLTPPPDTNLSGATLCLDYPDGLVGLPGTGNVSGRVGGFNGLSSVNDFDRSVQVALLPNVPASPLTLTLSFDRCLDAQEPLPGPEPSAFDCVVRQASDEFSNLIDPPTLVVCTLGGGLE